MFYITISNGLIKGEHRKRMGTAVWEFMWCIDKVTMIDKDGYGIILGGKPINLSDLGEDMNVSDDTISRNLSHLQEEGYIRIKRTPYGLILSVSKVKKSFGKNAVSKTALVPNLSAEMPNVIKTLQIDNTVRQERETKSLEEKEEDKQIGEIINDMIVVNPACRRMFGNKTQRLAVSDLITQYGFEQVKKVIGILPKTNGMAYMPTITSPVQLRDKWTQLESSLTKLKAKKTENTRNVIL